MENKKTALNEKEGQIQEETQPENEQIVPVETFEEGEIVDGNPKKKSGIKEAAMGFVGGAAAAVGAMNLSDDISDLLDAEVVDVEPEPDPNVAAEPTAQAEPTAEPVVDVEPTAETGEVAVTPEEIAPVAIDLNNDGTADALVVDQNNDGNAEAMGLDENQDGKVDTVFEDTDGDGDMDTIEVDTDFDGDFDNQQAIAEADQVTVELDVPQETHEEEAVVVDTDPTHVEEPVNAEPVAEVDIPEEEFDTNADMSEWA
jgi:hypothetical protein